LVELRSSWAGAQIVRNWEAFLFRRGEERRRNGTRHIQRCPWEYPLPRGNILPGTAESTVDAPRSLPPRMSCTARPQLLSSLLITSTSPEPPLMRPPSGRSRRPTTRPSPGRASGNEETISTSITRSVLIAPLKHRFPRFVLVSDRDSSGRRTSLGVRPSLARRMVKRFRPPSDRDSSVFVL